MHVFKRSIWLLLPPLVEQSYFLLHFTEKNLPSVSNNFSVAISNGYNSLHTSFPTLASHFLLWHLTTVTHLEHVIAGLQESRVFCARPCLLGSPPSSAICLCLYLYTQDIAFCRKCLALHTLHKQSHPISWCPFPWQWLQNSLLYVRLEYTNIF